MSSKKFPEMLQIECCLDSERGSLLACFVDKTFGELIIFWLPSKSMN